MAITPLELGHSPRPRPLTAAAVNLADGAVSKELLRQLKRHEAWQVDASGYFSEIGEIHYVVNRAASALSEAKLYCAAESEMGALVPVDAPESGIPENVAAAATDELSKLRLPVGGQPQLIHQAYVNAEVPGEFYLVETEDDFGEPCYWVRSILETKVKEPGEPVEIKGVGSVPFDSVSRVWRPHPMRFEAADSGMRPVLGACELVVLIDRHFRAAMRSRLFAGLLLLPNSFREGTTTTAEKGEPKSDPAVQALLDALSEGIQEEGTASAVVPNFLYGATDDIAAVRLQDLGQRVDQDTLELRESSIKRIVQGLEYPPEVVTGTGDVSHWGAWFIGDSFIDHLRPKGDFLADAFTTVFLRPGLEARGIDPEMAARIQVTFDYTPLQRKPNIVETATMAHDRYVISDESLRRDLGYDEDDAPTPEEITARVERRKQIRSSGEPGVSTGPPRESGEAPVTASALPQTTGGKLARIDFDLTERVLGAAVAAMRRAAERAGNRARSRVASAHREAVRHVPSVDVCAQLGPTLLTAAGITEDELLADRFDGLEKDFRRWADTAADEALLIALADGELSDEELRAWQQRRDANVDRAWEWLAGALTVMLADRIAEGGDPVDSEVRALVRQALAAAGGVTEFDVADEAGRAVRRIPVTAVTGIGTGPLTLDMLTYGGQEVAGWRWVHDSPQHPFPPHVALDGAEAATLEEFGIGFGGWPGDHAGCLCTIEPLVRRPLDD